MEATLAIMFPVLSTVLLRISRIGNLVIVQELGIEQSYRILLYTHLIFGALSSLLRVVELLEVLATLPPTALEDPSVLSIQR